MAITRFSEDSDRYVGGIVVTSGRLGDICRVGLVDWDWDWDDWSDDWSWVDWWTVDWPIGRADDHNTT